MIKGTVVVDRRSFLLGTIAIALMARGGPTKAFWHGGPTTTGFNGGLSQGQSNLNAGSVIGDWPFINFLKQQSGWQYNNGAINPSWLDSNGYPTAAALSGGLQVSINTNLPNQTSKPATFSNPIVVTWVGNSSISIGGLSGAVNFVSGSTAAILNGYGFSDGLYHGRYEWYPTYASDGSYSFNMTVASIEAASYINSLQTYFFFDETSLLAGEIFAPQFKSILKQMGIGVFRAMDWLNTNSCNMTTWASRKSLGYPVWNGDEYRASLYGGVAQISSSAIVNAALSSLVWSSANGGTVTATTSSPHGITVGVNFPVQIAGASPSGYNVANPAGDGDVIATATGASTFTYPLSDDPGTETVPGTYSANCLDYTVTLPGSYVWNGPNGNYAGGSPVDKQTMHLDFAVGAMLVQNYEGNGLTVTGFSPLTFNWPNCPLSNNDPVGISNGFKGGNLVAGVSPGQTYYAIVSGNTVKLALTPNGSAISSTSTSTGNNTFLTRLPTLSINSTTAVGFMRPGAQPMVDSSTILSTGGSRPIYATFIYDASLNSWIGSGGASGGINSGIPFEVILQLCNEMGMHPYFSLPPFALDPATDLATSLATYIQTNYQNGLAPWMIPRFEPGNEVWNVIQPITNYCAAKSFANWETYSQTGDALDNEYGKWCSVLGQGLASVFGLANLGTKYKVLSGSQYVSGTPYPTSRMLCPSYANQAAAPQAGYQKVPAANGTTNYVSTVIVALYTNATMQGEVGELQNAWLYYFGSSAGSNTYLNNYVDTLPGGSNPAPAWYAGTKAYGATYNVNEMNGYEGGYGPDLITGNVQGVSGQWNSPITGATNASSCVLTLVSFSSRDGAGGGSSNPAEVGMALCLQGVGGMTQLNCLSGSVTITPGIASIPWSGNILVANQAIVFQNNPSNPFPSNLGIQPLKTYYVSATGLSSSAFQISATPGGAVITPTGSAAYTANLDSGWAVTAVSGNSVTLLVNSTAFGSYTSNTGTAYYLASTDLVNQFRVQCLYAPDMYQKTLDNYAAWAANGGTFPSQYEISGQGSVWPSIQPDIFGAQSQEFAAIAQFNQ
jgi:hypothetical protein